MNFLHGLEMMKRYMNLYKSDRIFSKELSSISKFKFLIKKVEFVNSCRVAVNSRNRLDFTSSYDGFTNTLSRLPRDERFCVLKDILINANVKELVCNRVDLSDFRFVFENIFLERIYFKSCELVTMPSLIGCENVLLVNLVANNFKEVDFSNFPSSVKRINLSKNKIEKVYSPIVKNKKLESLAMFNNKISDFFWLKFFENLIYLNIGMNPFSKFPEEILMLDSLEHLVLALTDIKDIPLEILNLKKLKVLDLTGCPMIKFDDPVIQSLLGNGVKILC